MQPDRVVPAPDTAQAGASARLSEKGLDVSCSDCTPGSQTQVAAQGYHREQGSEPAMAGLPEDRAHGSFLGPTTRSSRFWKLSAKPKLLRSRWQMGRGPGNPQIGHRGEFPKAPFASCISNTEEPSHLETQTNTDKNNPTKPALPRQRTRKGAARQDITLLGNSGSSLEKHHCGLIPPVPTQVKWEPRPHPSWLLTGARVYSDPITQPGDGGRSRREETTVPYRQ